MCFELTTLVFCRLGMIKFEHPFAAGVTSLRRVPRRRNPIPILPAATGEDRGSGRPNSIGLQSLLWVVSLLSYESQPGFAATGAARLIGTCSAL